MYTEIQNILEYAKLNDMKLNLKKSKFMLFNQCRNFDFMPSMQIDGCDIQLVESMRILGVVISTDMKFNRNTEYIIKRAFKKVWMIKRLYNLGATKSQMLDVYIKQVRSILELAVPAWHPSLTIADKLAIERVQKSALQIIYGLEYDSYASACEMSNLPTLEERRIKLCVNFAMKALKNTKHSKWFKVNTSTRKTRQKRPMLYQVVSRTTRFERSPISYLTKLLNHHFS